MSEHAGPVERARRCWAEQQKALPDWVLGMARQCATTSQRRVADELGVSGALVSNVLGGKYTGDMRRIEDLYRGKFERVTLDCSALGEITLDTCRGWRSKSRELNPANAQNVLMFRACNGCPRNAEQEGAE